MTQAAVISRTEDPIDGNPPLTDSPVCVVTPLDTALRWSRDLPALLGGRVVFFTGRRPASPALWVGWGRKPSGNRARWMAGKFGMSYRLLEDGFLKSISCGPRANRYALVWDDEGVYYDATGPSRLERLIRRDLSSAEKQRAENLMSLWREHRVSKYNHSREYGGSLPRDYVLVVDQTSGDASIRYGQASGESFRTMLEAALDENPGRKVLLKLHPEVVTGRKKAHFDVASLSANDRVQILAEDAHPPRLLENAAAVYTVTSQMGFEALLWGRPVRTFGMPFYAGWGLTRDELPAPARRSAMPLENLVHSALVTYARYIHPETGRRCEPEALVEWMGLQRKMRARFPRRVFAYGFSRWKHDAVRRFFDGSVIEFSAEVRRSADAATAAWSGKLRFDDPRDSEGILKVEDGFIRSVGLGAELVQPQSWVIDADGIYYDARIPSGLEKLLQSHAFDSTLVARAAALRRKIVELGVTKYNVGSSLWKRPETSKKILLAVGQVESDASLRYGSASIRKNLEFLKAVRAAHPEAYIVYKPHPDVVSGLRLKGENEGLAGEVADSVVTECSLPDLFGEVDEVHVITSLTGFEALLRGKTVATYGQPFYAGWGLTKDFGLTTEVAARRSRALSVDELVAATLILYPTYLSRCSQRFTTPERVLEELSEYRRNGAPKRTMGDRFNRLVGKVFAN